MNDLNLFDVLEICLQSLEQGASLESCLEKFPAQAKELRPILTAAVYAMAEGSAIEVPQVVVNRGKERVLQAAAELRAQARPVIVQQAVRKRSWFGTRFFRLAVTTAAVLAFLLTGGTGLVNASSSAIPGDSLYPVKRSWEGVRLFFVFDQQAKVHLEDEFDHERVKEIQTLYSEKRFEQVGFQGVVQSQTSNIWIIDGLNIEVDQETVLSAQILPGAVVQVIGETDDGIIKAEKIILIAAPGSTPTTGLSPYPGSTPLPEFQLLPEATEAPESHETPEVNTEVESTVEVHEGTETPETNSIESEKTPEYQKSTEQPESTSKPEEVKTQEPDSTESGS